MNLHRVKSLFPLLLLGLLLTVIEVFAGTPGVVLDDEERQWIREHPIIRLGVDPAWPPFDFIDGQGAHSGMAADFLLLLGRQLGLSFELVPGLDWEQVLQRARDRSLDLVSLSQQTPQRSKYLRFTDTVTSVPWAVITRKNFKKISGLEALSAHRVAVVKSYAIVNMLSDEYPGIEIQLVDSSLDGLRAVAAGQVDAMVENLAVASYLIAENNLINLKIAADSGFDMIRLAFAVRSDWPELSGLLNKALSSLTRDEMQSVKNRWAAVETEQAGDSDSAPEFAGWLLWTVVAVFLLLVIVSGLLMRFTSGERLASRIGSTRFRAIVLVSLSVFVVLVLFLGWLAMERIEHRIRHDVGNNLDNSLISTMQRIDFWAEQRQDFIRQLGRHPRLVAITQALLAVPPARPSLLASSPLQQAREFFSDEQLDLFDHLGFFIISPEYINIGSMRDANLGARNLLAELLPRVFRGEAIFVPSIASDVSLSAPSGTTDATMFFAAPIQTADGEVIAALTLRIDPGGEFSRVLQFSRVGDSGDSYAFNRQGQLLSASRFHRTLLDVGLIGEDESEILRVEIRDPGGNLTEGYRPATPRSDQPLTLMAASAIRLADSRQGVLKQQQSVLRNTEGYRDYRGVPVFGAWTWHDETGMGVASEIDADEALATYYSVRNTVFAILAVTLLLSVGGTLLMLVMGQRTNRVLSQARDQLERSVEERTAELQASETSLRENQERLELTVGGSGDGLWEYKSQTGDNWFSPRFKEMLGYGEDDLPNKLDAWKKSVRPDDLDAVLAAFDTHLKNDVPYDIEYRLRASTGDYRWIRDRAKSLRDAQGRAYRTSGSISDITERKQAEIELAHSRKLINAVLAHSPAAIYLKDLEGRYLMVNPIWCEVTGVSRDRAIGATDFDFQSRDVAEQFVSNDRHVAATGRPVHSEEHLPQSDGMVHTYMSYKFPVADENGEVFAVGGVSSDITEIEQRERQYRILVDTIPGTVYRCRLDPQRTMLFISKEVENLSGYPTADFIDNAVRSFSSLIHADDAADVDKTVVTAVEQNQPYMIEYRVVRADGAIRHVYERGQGEYDDEGVAERLDGTIIDITEIKELQADLEKARQAADQANQAKSTFLANMSHELRTPMNAILGYSEMLMEEAEDLEQEDFIPDLKKINQAGNHLLALINDVLDLSKIEAGRMEAYAEDIDVGTLIDEVAATAQPLMGKNDNRLIIARGEALGNVYQDLTKLRQSLFNLLSNAAKFTHQGSVTLRVERESRDGGDWLVFAVSDTGIGIAEDKLEHVFTEFSQADSSTTRNYGGTGLGLAISKRFCQILGGDLTLQSVPGEGSTFTIRLPATLPGSEPRQAPADAAAIKTAANLEAIGETGPGETVLVIDDEAEACEIIGRFLQKDGFTVVTAGSGEEGLRLAHDIQPAAITLDVMMPDMDGWSVLRALKADPRLREVPVIMVTMVDDKTRGYSLGATDYLTKPVDRELLLHMLGRYHPAEKHRTVMLVEDDEATREMMARTLDKAGWAVSEAGNGREALDQLAQETPRLILLDLMMPVMDGFDFLLEMRANADWQDIPVIVLTAKDLTDEDRRMLSGRVEQVVAKGACSREHLMELVRGLVTSTRTRRLTRQ